MVISIQYPRGDRHYLYFGNYLLPIIFRKLYFFPAKFPDFPNYSSYKNFQRDLPTGSPEDYSVRFLILFYSLSSDLSFDFKYNANFSIINLRPAINYLNPLEHTWNTTNNLVNISFWKSPNYLQSSFSEGSSNI